MFVSFFIFCAIALPKAVFSFIAERNEDYNNVTPSPPVVKGGVANDDDFLMKEIPITKKSKSPIYAFTVAVGKKASHASQYVNDARDVADILISMAGGDPSAMVERTMSWDMEEMGTDLFA